MDGIVRVYHGNRRLPKAHVARMRRSMPATSDDWLDDTTSDPLFVVTAEVNAGVAQMLLEMLQESAVERSSRNCVGATQTGFELVRGFPRDTCVPNKIADVDFEA